LTSGTVGIVRLVFARVPDRLGPVRGTTVALALVALGMFGLAAWQSPVGLYLSLLPLATGTALLFPSLLLAALAGTEDHERSRVVAGYTLFIDLSAGLSPAILGVVASMSTYSTAFAIAGGSAVLGLALLHAWFSPQLRRTATRAPRPDEG
jgi:dipeptide/tripeptide permease